MPSARLTAWDHATCSRVHEATLTLLEETGIEIRHQQIMAGSLAS